MRTVRSLVGAREVAYLRWWWLALLAFWLTGASASPFSEKDFAPLIRQHFLLGTGAPLQEDAIAETDAKRIVRKNLDSALLTRGVRISGVDFRFVPPSQDAEAHVAVLVLSYSNSKIALSMANTLSKLNNYFRRTKILTRFSTAPVGKQLVIAFTEDAGNELMVKFVDAVPLRLHQEK